MQEQNKCNNCVSATYISIWDNGAKITFPCKVNLDSREVFDIELEPDVLDDFEFFQGEMIRLANGKEYPLYGKSHLEPNDAFFWYNDTDSLANALNLVLLEKAPVKKRGSMNKRQLCEDIGVVYGEFFVRDGHFCIDNDEKIFYYDSEDALLVDWLDTLLESHYNDYHIDEEGRKWDCWEEGIIFIYEKVIGKFPVGIRPVENKGGRTWMSSVEVNDGSRHGKNLHLGTYDSIVDAIFAREKFLEQAACVNRNQPDFIKSYLALAAQIEADMLKVQESRVDLPLNSSASENPIAISSNPVSADSIVDIFNVKKNLESVKTSLADQIQSASSRASDSHPVEHQPVKTLSSERYP